ncbi:fructosamine kinase family protein [Mesonia ostreae]|uniref:Fructosamine kinase family protein n=1 Tax=Mesonia ostreae TaxID=861110 RepID=A0ABU2KFV6_9FLAO|nr:fructosamine kinase family protein [Mesonia ostreae]MDT0293593.1 fructosamine kinase family protein [Mesonia ostreae]
MLPVSLKTHLEEMFLFSVKETKALSGGDINEVYLLKTSYQDYVVKVNKVNVFPAMFKKEVNGLETLRKTHSIDIPEVLGFGDFEHYTYLVLAHKESGKESTQFWETFGRQMAALHQNSQEHFGFEEDNYYGSLWQCNKRENTASAFFIQQRLMPQFQLAGENGYEFAQLDTFYKKIEQLIPQEKPSLIHGDLWAGNYLINAQNQACLIDPAVSYAPREMDLAMMHLFGGFDDRLFQTYNEAFPLKEDWKARVKLWQLYYILGHVNLFGGNYYNSAKAIIKSYS